MRPGEVAAVLTAAGRSTRMGTPKALLDWRGRPLLTHQVLQLATLGQVVVVLGHEPEALRPAIPQLPNVTVVLNRDYDLGRVSSLVAGFKAIKGAPEGVLVAAVDQPLAEGVVDVLVDWGEGAIVVPAYGERRGHPVLFRGDLLPELREIREETEGLRAIAAKYRAERREVTVPWPEVLLDLNSPEDYQKV